MRATHRPRKDASIRTKNWFKEYTMVLVEEEPTVYWTNPTYKDQTMFFESAEKDEKGVFAKWCGWVPANEVERH
jgi:hypothetical protein|tara:strand:- start:188 stop:409 length:222 start_codon:yes stop_codon:yes gene_type:complete